MKSAMKWCAFLLMILGACALGYAQGAKQELKPVAFATLDTNKDGKISRQEARAAPDLADAFDALDTNHDGFLSPAEFQAWPRALKPTNPVRDPSTAPGGSAGAQHMTPSS